MASRCGSVNANNQISSFSNKAGTSANFYVVAPGEAIRAIDNVGDAVVGTGTSMSAPHVSGAAALLKQAFPHLTGAQIVDLILRTATDLGAPGTDAVYGRGLLNVAGAMAPVGTASIPTETMSSGASLPLSTSSLRLGAAFGDALASNGALKNSIMLDDYQRAYTVDLTGRVARPQPQHDLVDWLGGGKNYDFVAAPVGATGQASFSDRTVRPPDHRTHPARRRPKLLLHVETGARTPISASRRAGRWPRASGWMPTSPRASTPSPETPPDPPSSALPNSGRNVSIRTDLGDGISIATGFASRREAGLPEIRRQPVLERLRRPRSRHGRTAQELGRRPRRRPVRPVDGARDRRWTAAAIPPSPSTRRSPRSSPACSPRLTLKSSSCSEAGNTAPRRIPN